MALGSCVQQSFCVNLPANPIREQDELAGQSPVQKFNAGSNEAPVKAPIPLKTLTPTLVPFSTKDLFIKFMKVFMEMTQAQAQALAELPEQLLKARSPKTYSGKSHIDCYHFCQ